jgi:hypothetical protein
VKPRLAILFCAAAFTGVFAKNDTIPSWLDTLAPVVRIQPRETYHPSIFHVTFKANKQATFWYRIVSPSGGAREMVQYRDPVTVMEEGTTRVYFYGEDLMGNKSSVDSAVYILDSRPPQIAVSPEPGRYHSAITVRCSADKPCTFLFYPSLIDTAHKSRIVADSIVVKDSLSGYFVAIDRAGNTTFSGKLTYVVDSATVHVDIRPKEGIYGSQQEISFTSNPPADVFFTFDPSAPPRLFMRYEKPVELPYGNTIVRFYGRNSTGWESEIMKSTYVVDTVPPKIRFEQNQGAAFDTLVLTTKKPTTIRYTLDGAFPTDASPVYMLPVVVPRKGKCTFRAVAKDLAGNRSELLKWEYKYDKTPPVPALSKQSGSFRGAFRVYVTANKPASVLYTLDGTQPLETSNLYKDGIPISKEGTTVLRVIAIDDAGNVSPELRADYVIDTKPPFVTVRVEEDARQNLFLITLTPDKEAVVRYEIDGTPGETSPVFKEKIQMRMGQVLRYFAVDKAGNRSETKLMDDLKKPIVSVVPEGGVHRRPVKAAFWCSPGSVVYWRLLPDTSFTVFKDSLYLSREGVYTLEYYSVSQNGLVSPLRRSEYTLDLTPPFTDVIVKKGNKDSVTVFFECSKKATIYYTLDGTNPASSKTAKTAGDKFHLSSDRISVQRKDDVRLAFFAEDAAGNQSPIRVLDVFKPAAVPDIPAGPGRVYDRVLSINLNTFDSKGVVHYARHGHVPTMDSAVFARPITLVSSDTIMAFAVDASGFRGPVDTFVYLIDLPPSPAFTWLPGDVKQGTTVVFDASASLDMETSKDRLNFRWDFNGDGVFETGFSTSPRASHTFTSSGRVRVTLEVRDEAQHVASLTKEVLVRQLCPPGMASVALDRGTTFCIDTYEWPNIAGQKPMTMVSWVQAKISCMDAGKRLCSREEWTAACRTSKKTAYPYGQKYVPGKCPAEGSAEYKSGSFPQCGEPGGARDMVGNVWEWTEDKKGDYPLMLGGSFRFGEAADCYLSSEGGVGLKSAEVGFRCCK